MTEIKYDSFGNMASYTKEIKDDEKTTTETAVMKYDAKKQGY